MKIIVAIVILLFSAAGYSQSSLKLFQGSFDQAFDSSRIQNKDILLIVGSNHCGYYVKFKRDVLTDSSVIALLNAKFIIYLFIADDADKVQRKRFKRYNKSWPGWPQFYFLDSKEKLIADLGFPEYTSNLGFIELMKSYRDIELEWKLLKKKSRKEQLSLEELTRYIKLRDANYNSFGDIQRNRQISKYFKAINPSEYHLKKHWFLFKRYVGMHEMGLNKKLFDFVAQNKTAFQSENGEEEVSNYLFENYKNDINWRKEDKVNKMAKTYPYNTISEAMKAVQCYKQSVLIKTMIQPLNLKSDNF